MPSRKKIIRKMHKDIQDLEHDIDLLASLVDWVTDIDRMTDDERTTTLREWAAHNGPEAESLLYDAFGIEAEDKGNYVAFVDVPLSIAIAVKADNIDQAKQVGADGANEGEIRAIFKSVEDIAASLNYDMAEVRLVLPQ